MLKDTKKVGGKTTFQKNVINSELLRKEMLHNAVVSLFCL